MLELLARPHPVYAREEAAQDIRARIADPEEADILLDRLQDAWELADELKHRLGKRAARRVLCTPAHMQAGSMLDQQHCIYREERNNSKRCHATNNVDGTRQGGPNGLYRQL